MSRLAQAIMQQGSAYGTAKNAPMVNVLYGGMNGLSADYTEWVNNHSYIRQPLIAILMESPKGFNFMPNKAQWIGTLKALVELHADSIDGLNKTLEVESVESAVGGSGNMHEDFVDVKRTRTEVTFKWREKYGMPINSFLESWITFLMMDPDSKVPLISTITGTKPTDMLADMYSASILFFEPDILRFKVMKAWLGTNMWPKTAGENVARRELTSPGETTTYDVRFAGIYQVGGGVDALAQSVLESMSLTGANPNLRNAFLSQISPDVAAVSRGLANNISDLEGRQVATVVGS